MTIEGDKPALKPCPRCGSQPSFGDYTYAVVVACHQCADGEPQDHGTGIYKTTWADAEKRAAEAWNDTVDDWVATDG